MPKNKLFFIKMMLVFSCSVLLLSAAYARAPLWTFEPRTPTRLHLPFNGTATVQYVVTNQSNRTHRLSMQSIKGIKQKSFDVNFCAESFVLEAKQSCILSLECQSKAKN